MSIRLPNIEPLLEILREKHSVSATATQQLDRHLLQCRRNVVYVAHNQRGNWLYGRIGDPHHHEDDNLLSEHFHESVAALLEGRQACGACPVSPPTS